MAKQVWNDPINKHIDWGGDENTLNRPVSGEMVQRFIKETLDKKAGDFYYDASKNRYLIFSDEEDREIYLNDLSRTDLIKGTFDAPFNYSAEINLISESYNAIFLGTTGNYVDFTYDIKNKQGSSTGENVTITFTFMRNSVKKVVTQVGHPNKNIHFNIDPYLGEGTNTIIIGVTGQSTLAATTVAVTYQVVNLQLSDNLDISNVYDLSTGSKILEVPFKISGYGTKVIEWYLDGTLLPFVKTADEVVEIETERTKYIELANLQQGRHSLQIRAYTTINGDRFYTDTLYRDIIVYTGVSTSTILAVAAEIPSKYGILDSLIIYNITQYVPYTLRFASYSPINKESVQINITLDEELKGQISSGNNIENLITFGTTTFGNKTLVLTEQDDTYTIPVLVNKTNMNIEEIISDLEIDFSASGRNNKSSDKNSWEYNDYVGTFKGFNWNSTSGWVNNVLKMNAGSSFEINYAPLLNNPTSTGKTIELEFKTTNVNDDNAIICDLRNSNGTGIIIRATKASLISANGVVVETEFKSEETVRISFVINKSTGTTRKGMSFIYANGCISRGIDWASTDNYNSDALLKFTASTDAEIELKSFRIYNTALSDDQILNNYILYQDSIVEMMDIYDRNNIYIDGTNTFSPDKAASRLPVMIVTGNIPVLENTSNKNEQIIVDIEYTNLQYPDKSFKMVGAAMRPQGTSSMGYPKKNFRIYTQEVDETILYDSNGNIVPDKLYSFKEGSIPVNCWCLKADYAESSGTHNTGIARLWNTALYNMQVDGQYVCRTDAQKAAIANGYNYDVRTTIDGFPILLFYKPTANDEPIFIGKYNFNNDKSTEGVFGFTDIPGFDNSRMQCWEIKNNGNPLALFKTMDGFDSGWKDAYESRYPDTKTPYLGDLKAFSQWMVGVNGDAERFATEKWDHFKIYPMAAYYVYIMRHAAADQLAKNAMFTSEDGQHFYFIQYDNDTINGLNNLGEIDLPPDADRQSKDESGEYLFAAHESVLWNMFEADTEFMEIVKVVDNALYSAGISYDNLIKMFDEEQSDKWSERVYNQDTEYKYIGPFVNQGINELGKLQGKRDLHRRWWLSKRFSIYDAKYVSGKYKAKVIDLKCKNDTLSGQSFTITSGYKLDYGYGINDGPRDTGVTLDVGESHTFTTKEVINLGDPVRIYAAPNITELNVSSMANRLAVVTIDGVYDENLGTKFKKFILGGENVSNSEVTEISGLKQAKLLEELNIQGMKGIGSLDLSNQPYLKTLKAYNSGLKAVQFAKGANITALELPSTMTTLVLEQLPYLQASGVSVQGGMKNVKALNVTGCPNLSKDFTWVYNWYSANASSAKECSLTMDNVDWTGVDPTQLIALKNLGTLNLKGKVEISEVSEEIVNQLREVFGDTAFSSSSDFYIIAPPAVFLSGRTELLEGESEQYICVAFGGEVLRTAFSIVSGANQYVSMNQETGLLTTTEGMGNRNLTLRVTTITSVGTMIKDMVVSVKARVYPSQSQTSIAGANRLEKTKETYTLAYSVEGITGDMIAEWTLTGMDDFVVIDSYTDSSCVLKTLKQATSLKGSLSCKLTKRYNNQSLFTVSRDIFLVDDTIAETDSGICQALYDAGLTASPEVVTKDEARLITGDDLQPGTSSSTSVFYSQRNNIKSFEGFKYFTSVSYVKAYTFENFKSIESITFPPSCTEVGEFAFRGCKGLKNVTLNDWMILRRYAFRDTLFSLKNLKVQIFEESAIDLRGCEIEVSEKVTLYYTTPGEFKIISKNDNVQIAVGDINNFAQNITSFEVVGKVNILSVYFTGSNLKTAILPEEVSTSPTIRFESCTALEEVYFPKNVKRLSERTFFCCTSLKKIHNLSTINYCTTLSLFNCPLLDLDLLIDRPMTMGGGFANGCPNVRLSLSEDTTNVVMDENGLKFSHDGSLISFWGSGEVTLTSTSVMPGVFAFSGVTKVNLAPNTNNIGYYAFYGCDKLSEINGLENANSSNFTIGDYAFAKSSLSTFDFTNVRYLDPYAFAETLLEEIHIPSSTIPDLISQGRTFKDCKKLKKVYIDCSLTSYSTLFEGCTSLEEIVVGEPCVKIIYEAFNNLPNLKKLEFPSTMTEIPQLRNLPKLQTITCRAAIAPTAKSNTFGTGDTNYIGRDTYNTGENILYVPTGATGYDTGRWLDPLQDATKCGFTLSATL